MWVSHQSCIQCRARNRHACGIRYQRRYELCATVLRYVCYCSVNIRTVRVRYFTVRWLHYTTKINYVSVTYNLSSVWAPIECLTAVRNWIRLYVLLSYLVMHALMRLSFSMFHFFFGHRISPRFPPLTWCRLFHSRFFSARFVFCCLFFSFVLLLPASSK